MYIPPAGDFNFCHCKSLSQHSIPYKDRIIVKDEGGEGHFREVVDNKCLFSGENETYQYYPKTF